mgnify:CR=1 FL=1
MSTPPPKIGVIGGSGLYDLPGIKNLREVRVQTPFGYPSDAYFCGELSGREVVFLARHARGHRILPGELNHRANIWGFKKLGVAWVVGVGAVGSLQEKYPPRTIVLPDQYFDRTKHGLDHTFFGRGIVAHIAFSEPVCVELQKILYQAARALKAKVFLGGTYVNMEGPAFSTQAESRFYRKQGFDVIGMTGLAEARLCREAEIAYAPMGLVTDYDCWHKTAKAVTMEMVVGNLLANADIARRIIARAIPRIPAQPVCSCRRALDTAIITDKKFWPQKTRSMLEPILRRFF